MPWYEQTYDQFIRSVFPVSENLIPWHNITNDGWVIGNNPRFNTQWVQCAYPISGGYGIAPRYIFYCLSVFALLRRRTAWIATAALGSVMTYSSTAAVHAIVVVAMRTRLVPRVRLNNHGLILAEGSSKDGIPHDYDSWDSNSNTGALWLPLMPSAWDADSDPVLAIVGVAWLILMPMQFLSNTFKRSEAKALLFLWSGLVFIGCVCANFNEYYVGVWTFPQLRFCPPGLNDSLPITSSGSNTIGGTWDGSDRYRWNETVYEYFRNPEMRLSNVQNSSVCIYPCLETSWPLRNSAEITVMRIPTGAVADGSIGWRLLFAVYAIVFFSTLCALTLFATSVYENPPARFRKWSKRLQDKMQRLYQPFFTYAMVKMKKTPRFLLFQRNPKVFRPFISIWTKFDIRKACSATWNLYKNIVVKTHTLIVSPIAVVVTVTWMEWYIWVIDPPGETIQHIGQWGALVGASFVIIAATVGQYLSKPAESGENEDSTIALQTAESNRTSGSNERILS